MFYHFSEDIHNPDLVLINTLDFTKTYLELNSALTQNVNQVLEKIILERAQVIQLS